MLLDTSNVRCLPASCSPLAWLHTNVLTLVSGEFTTQSASVAEAMTHLGPIKAEVKNFNSRAEYKEWLAAFRDVSSLCTALYRYKGHLDSLPSEPRPSWLQAHQRPFDLGE